MTVAILTEGENQNPEPEDVKIYYNVLEGGENKMPNHENVIKFTSARELAKRRLKENEVGVIIYPTIDTLNSSSLSPSINECKKAVGSEGRTIEISLDGMLSDPSSIKRKVAQESSRKSIQL